MHGQWGQYCPHGSCGGGVLDIMVACGPLKGHRTEKDTQYICDSKHFRGEDDRGRGESKKAPDGNSSGKF